MHVFFNQLKQELEDHGVKCEQSNETIVFRSNFMGLLFCYRSNRRSFITVIVL